MKLMKKRKNARNQGNKLPLDNSRSTKDASTSAKQHTRCIAFGESVVRSSIENDFHRCKQTKVVRV